MWIDRIKSFGLLLDIKYSHTTNVLSTIRKCLKKIKFHTHTFCICGYIYYSLSYTFVETLLTLYILYFYSVWRYSTRDKLNSSLPRSLKKEWPKGLLSKIANNLGIITLLSRIISHNLRSFVKKKIYIYNKGTDWWKKNVDGWIKVIS